MSKRNIVVMALTAVSVLGITLATFYFMPPESLWISGVLSLAIILYFVIVLIIRGQRARVAIPKRWHGLFSLTAYFFLMLIVFGILFFYVVPSIMMIVLMVALTFTLVINFITVPLAIRHRFIEAKIISKSITVFPRVSIIVPAFNEEAVLGRTIENLLEAYYPNKEIIVVDDGSADRTFEVAKRYELMGVKVVHRVNGGKFAALNTALMYTTGEYIISVDADSLVTRSAIVEIVKSFENPNVGGVAGTLKVLNANKFLTQLQAMEYLIQIEVVRRAFDTFGVITVAPGAFSAFRRSALDEVGRYDPDRLLEDFDLTIKMQKSHQVVRGNSEAICYTEAPETIRDIYKQRLSWYRGDFQNFWKHRDAFVNSKFGFMYSLTMPYMLISMTLVPLAGILVIISSIIMLINGEGMTVLLALIIFVFMQFMLSILSIELGKERFKLCLYSIFYIVGYKQFLDFVMIQAFFDVLLNGGHYTKRERVQRIGYVKL
jgi:cellulose synthase/poly-beta-1,6-N-acetylglucosamine synthase-like glycosyltransferase